MPENENRQPQLVDYDLALTEEKLIEYSKKAAEAEARLDELRQKENASWVT